jgi:hypothetical protein
MTFGIGWLTYPFEGCDGIDILGLRIMFGFGNLSAIGVDVSASGVMRIGGISSPVTGLIMKL